jgi:hypothetical protein
MVSDVGHEKFLVAAEIARGDFTPKPDVPLPHVRELVLELAAETE